MTTAVDFKLRGHQVEFRQDRSCTDHIATLRIIIEQSMEWNSSFCINFIDYEKAFDSVDRETLCMEIAWSLWYSQDHLSNAV